MEPIKGGSLANPPESVMRLFREKHPGASASSWALRWVAGMPNVMTVLSGMSTMEQLEDNLRTFTAFQPLDSGEQAVLERAAAEFKRLVKNGCTGCRYCMPCPAGVDIPLNFKLWNDWGMFHNPPRFQARWGNMEEASRATSCVGCGACDGEMSSGTGHTGRPAPPAGGAGGAGAVKGGREHPARPLIRAPGPAGSRPCLGR